MLSALGMLAVLAGPARADQAVRILVIPIETEAKGPVAAASGELTTRLGNIMFERGAEPIVAEVSLPELAALSGCTDVSASCLEKIAATMAVEQVISAELKQEAPERYAVELIIYRADRPVASGTVRFQADDPDAATEQFSREARKVIDRALAGKPADPEPEPDPLTTPAKPEPQPSSGFSFGRVETYSYAVAGGGVALLGLGAVFYALASGKQSDIDSAPTDSLADLQALEELEGSASNYALLGNLSTVVGGVAAATGITLIILQGRRGEQPPSAQVTPMALRDGFGVSFTVRGDL